MFQAVNGMGIDRMLLGLKKIALECGMNVPDFYMDSSYTTSTHFKLSTSQVKLLLRIEKSIDLF